MPRKAKQTKDQNLASLIEALQFICTIQKKDGDLNQTHCNINNGFIYAYNGSVSLGVPITEDLNACPHSMKLLSALKKCTEKVSITQLNSGKLSIKSGKFRAYVECVAADMFPSITPDPNIAAIGPDIAAGLSAVLPLLVDNPPTARAFTGAALLQANSIIGTNGAVLLEYWHGVDLPPNILIPKEAAALISKRDKELIGFGFSHSSATFHYKDGSFIKTQLIEQKYPNTNIFFDGVGDTMDIPDNLFDSISKIKDFASANRIHFKEGCLSTSMQDDDGAIYEISGLPTGFCLNYQYMEMVKDYFKKAWFSEDKVKVNFFGGPCRGVIVGIKL